MIHEVRSSILPTYLMFMANVSSNYKGNHILSEIQFEWNSKILQLYIIQVIPLYNRNTRIEYYYIYI